MRSVIRKMRMVWGMVLMGIVLLGVELPVAVYAAENNVFEVSATRISLRPEQKKTLSVRSAIGIGRINIESSDEAVVSVNKAAVFIDLDAVEVELTAKKTGVVTITLTTSNFAIFETEESKNGISQSVTVTVAESGDSDDSDSIDNTDNTNNTDNTDNADDSSDSSDERNTGTGSDDEDIIVPNTFADDGANKTSNTTIKSPVTGGGNQGGDEGMTVIYMLPIALIMGTVVLYLRRKNKMHRKFE